MQSALMELSTSPLTVYHKSGERLVCGESERAKIMTLPERCLAAANHTFCVMCVHAQAQLFTYFSWFCVFFSVFVCGTGTETSAG